MKTKINPKLSFNFPKSNKVEIFQIVSVGGFRRNITKRNLWEINVYFQRRYLEGKQSLYGDILSKWININQAPFLKVGSLWNEKGKQIRSNVYTDKSEFCISPNTKGKITTLDNCFKNYKFVLNLFDEKLLDLVRNKIPYFGIEVEKDSYVLIPCFELLRFLCYRGSITIQYLLSPLDEEGNVMNIHDLCRPLQKPTLENLKTLKVVLNSDAFSVSDIRILSELAISNHLNIELKRAHNVSLSKLYTDNTLKNDKEEVFITFNPKLVERVFDFKATGVKVSYFKSDFFIVSSIYNGGGFYSYDKLEFKFDTTKTKKDKEDRGENDEDKKITGLSIIASHNPEDITVDDDQEAHSLIKKSETYFDNDDDIYDLPSMVENPNIIEKDSGNNSGKTAFFQVTPEILSNRLGGSDLNVGGSNIDYDTNDSGNGLSIEEISQEEYFVGVIRKFIEDDFDVECLNYNNSNYTYGAYLSVFPVIQNVAPSYYHISNRPRKFGIIEIQLRDNSFYYYLQIFDSLKRAGFLYKSNFERFTESEFNEIVLKDIGMKEIQGDWSALSKLYSEREYQFEMRKKRGFYIFSKARNTKNLRTIPQSCLRDIVNSRNL
jgi:hypothetical protein